MAIDRSEQFHKRKSDAMRLIEGAIKKAEEAPVPEIAEAFENKEEAPIIKAPSNQPKKAGRPISKKGRQNKRVTLYLTEEEYNLFREYAFRKHKTMNELIVSTARRFIGGPPPKPMEYKDQETNE